MLNLKSCCLIALLAFFHVANAHEIAAEAKPTNVAIFIQAQDYNHQIMLRNYSQDYWYSQAPLLEDAAIKVLGHDFKEAAMCDTNPSASKVMVWLRPRMFYNPQVQTFYGKVLAYVYTADGKPLANYVGEAKKRAFFDVKTEDTLKVVYQAATQAASAKMQADTKFQDAFKAPATAFPCATTSLLPEPKVQFMSIQ